jgi:hypothetical protein
MIRDIFILHHTHVDLGYTDSREKVFGDQVDMVDEATDLVNASAQRPEPERFRWIHEVSWPVFEYLRRGGTRREEMFAQIRAGSVELGAFYVNPTELFDRDEFERSLDYSCRLARDEGLPLTTAMFCDCPGIAWSVPDLLAARGIRYLSTAPNIIMSRPLEIERPFYWEGPKGGRVLTWFTDWRRGAYGEGLDLMRLEDAPSVGVERLLGYLRDLENEGYRWRGLALHLAQDNYRARPAVMDFVARFNAAQDKVTARLATNRDFFEFMEKQHGGEFAVHRAAWPDWWGNGSASAAYESACSRRTKTSLRRTLALGRMLGREPDATRVDPIVESMLLFDEHTWGARGSAGEPWRPDVRLQWTQKRSHALRGLALAERLEADTAASLAAAGRLVVANPFDSDWTGVVRVARGPGWTGPPVLRERGTDRTLTGQACSTTQDLYVLSVPARGTRTFEAVASRQAGRTTQGLESDFYRLTFDPATGAIGQVFDKRSGREICDAAAPWTFAELIHERVRRGSREAFYDSTVMDGKRLGAQFVRRAAHVSKRSAKLVTGPLFNALITRGALPGVKFVREVRVFHDLPRIDVVLHLDKQIVTTYESVYLAFPFAVESPEVWIENAGAAFRAGVDQLPGSATDGLSLGEYAAVSNPSQTVILAPHDVPMVQVADINTGKWLARMEVKTAHLFSWIMNNIWYTNFPGYQEGRMEFTWSVTSCAKSFDRMAAERFAHDVRVGAVVCGPPGGLAAPTQEKRQ